MGAMPWIYPIFGLLILLPFAALALGSVSLLSRRSESGGMPAWFGGLAAVATMWVAVLTVFFLFAALPADMEGDVSSWLNLAGALLLLSGPVFLIAAAITRRVNFNSEDG
jgi:hypothetical protein